MCLVIILYMSYNEANRFISGKTASKRRGT